MSSLPPPTFGALLRRARRAAGSTQEELAERAGISVDAISALERALSRAPHQDTLERLSEALQLSAEERAQWDLSVRGKRLPGADTEASELLVPPPVRLGNEPQPPASRPPLPAAPTALIGREQEVQAICALLQRPQVRLLTLSGSAGGCTGWGRGFGGGVHFPGSLE